MRGVPSAAEPAVAADPLPSRAVTARRIDGTAVAADVRAAVAADVAAFVAAGGPQPGLATVLVGDDPASQVYVRSKRRISGELGIASLHHDLPASASQSDVEGLVERLNADPAVHGILVQSPLPRGLDEEAVFARIDPAKDVDGLTPVSLGRLVAGQPGLRPCTPSGCIELLRRYEVPLVGARAVVVGRSILVGKPVALLLLEQHCTVTVCHSRTRDLAGEVRRADILVAAIGRPGFITADMLAPGATVLDVGISRTDEGLRGDVDPAAFEVAGAMTPVPGGVGPMTIAMLMRNTLEAAKAQTGA
jgi:methylenetetrahydrofolate dehydrogenase (NADP+) / methenyltetrahydrofolate cyclohydrolase